MPITTQCPFCEKPYRLKDELAGKKVACGNPNCRQTFAVPASTNGHAPAKPAAPAAPAKPAAKKPTDPDAIAAAALAEELPAPKAKAKPKPPTAPPPPDADAIAAAALAEEPDNIPQDTRTVAVTCVMCEHKWDVPWAMQGKNVLCPECRHRQKVPEQKKRKASDWRDGTGGPSIARQEELEGVQGTVNTRHVSGETLVKTGVVRTEYEPRPLWHYFAVVLLPLMLVGGIVYGVMSWRQDAREERQDRTMAEAVGKMKEVADTPYPPTEQPLFRAALLIAAGEHGVRQAKNKEELNAALAHWNNARAELEAAPASRGRDLLVVELALAWIAAGGDDAQTGEGSRIYWERPRNIRIQLNEKPINVEEEVGKVAAMLNHPGSGMAELRLDALRRMAREFEKRGQAQYMFRDGIASMTVPPEELKRAQGEVAAELYRLNEANREKAAHTIDNLRPILGTDIVPPAIQALAEKLDAKGTLKFRPPPAESGDLPPETREAYVMLRLLQGKHAEAIDLAKRGGGNPESRLSVLALVAEGSPNPADAVTAALELVAAEAARTDKKSAPIGESVHLYRIARQVGRAGMLDKLDTVLNAVKDQKDESVRAWLRALAVREYALTRPEGAVVEDKVAEVPLDPKDYRAGHAWMRLAVVRQNVKATGNSPVLDGWNTTQQPFGLAGIALGKQDRDHK